MIARNANWGAKNAFLGTFPRYALEALGMVAIALVGGALVLQRGSGAAVIPSTWCLGLGGTTLVACLAADLSRLGLIERGQRGNPVGADNAQPAFATSGASGRTLTSA